MSLEPTFPFEFLVRGVPVSFQNKGGRSLRDWRAAIISAYSPLLPEGHWAVDERVDVTIFYFPDGAMDGDIDNIVKPILDAMSGSIYIDDRQVERVLVQKFETGRMSTFTNPTETLARALETQRPIVYVRIDRNDGFGTR